MLAVYKCEEFGSVVAQVFKIEFRSGNSHLFGVHAETCPASAFRLSSSVSTSPYDRASAPTRLLCCRVGATAPWSASWRPFKSLQRTKTLARDPTLKQRSVKGAGCPQLWITSSYLRRQPSSNPGNGPYKLQKQLAFFGKLSSGLGLCLHPGLLLRFCLGRNVGLR